jgi:hypothetical protein
MRTGKMPRVKQTKPKRVDVSVTSVDAPAVSPDAVVFAPGTQDAAPAPAVPEVGPKKARVSKPKPCVRCEERRKREREYAKSSRLRLRLAATNAPPTTPADNASGSSGEQPAAASTEATQSAEPGVAS